MSFVDALRNNWDSYRSNPKALVATGIGSIFLLGFGMAIAGFYSGIANRSLVMPNSCACGLGFVGSTIPLNAIAITYFWLENRETKASKAAVELLNIN